MGRIPRPEDVGYFASKVDRSRKSLLPLTSTGDHSSPSKGRIALRWLCSRMNHGAHLATTGRPYRHATRYSTNTGSSSHGMVLAPSRSAPDFVLANSADTATKCRAGSFLPGTATLPRKHWALRPREAAMRVRPESWIWNDAPPVTVAHKAPISASPPTIETKWKAAWPFSSLEGSRTIPIRINLEAGGRVLYALGEFQRSQALVSIAVSSSR